MRGCRLRRCESWPCAPSCVVSSSGGPECQVAPLPPLLCPTGHEEDGRGKRPEVKPRSGAGGAVVHGCCAAPRCREGTAAPSAPISARLDRRSATARLVGPGGAAAAVAQELSVGGLVVSFFLRRV